MRHLAIIALALLATPALAQDYSDPKALVQALYDGYGSSHEAPPDQTPMLSARLNGLFEADSKEAGDEVGRIDFDPFVNGQDYEITKVVVSEPYVAAGKAVVRVNFDNFGEPDELGLLLVKEGAGWKIDDVWDADAEYSYDLLDILQAPLP